jgi:uroporphyrinogen-III synthase
MLEKGSKTIAITRPVGKGKDTAQLVRSLGWTPLIFHTVQLKQLSDSAVRDQIRSRIANRPIDWIVFMSSNGVKPMLTNLDSETGRENLRETRHLAVGPRTKEALLNFGVAPVEVPERYSSNGVREFFSRLHPENLRIVLVRSSSSGDSLAMSLGSMGGRVDTINVYDSEMPNDLTSAHTFLDHMRAGVLSAVLFTSALSVSNLFRIADTRFEPREIVRLLNGVSVGAIGPPTAEELRKRGLDPILPDEYLIESAVKKLVVPMSSALL